MAGKASVVSVVNEVLAFIRAQATSREDGNTEGLVDRIMRDLGQLQSEYRGLTSEDMATWRFLDEPSHTSEFTEDTNEVVIKNAGNKEEGLAGQTKSGKGKTPIS